MNELPITEALKNDIGAAKNPPDDYAVAIVVAIAKIEAELIDLTAAVRALTEAKA